MIDGGKLDLFTILQNAISEMLQKSLRKLNLKYSLLIGGYVLSIIQLDQQAQRVNKMKKTLDLI